MVRCLVLTAECVFVILFCQLDMLTALGLNSVLLTDGSCPINLFNTAEGLVGGTGQPDA